MLRYLLDTNICIYVIKERPRSMLECFNRHAGHMAISAITVNDLHIAAHARSEGLTLVSNNLREFQQVDGLMLENWV